MTRHNSKLLLIRLTRLKTYTDIDSVDPLEIRTRMKAISSETGTSVPLNVGFRWADVFFSGRMKTDRGRDSDGDL